MLDTETAAPVVRTCRWRSQLRIFLSYRRRDVGGYAGRLHDALSQRLGQKNVFQDVSAIAPGQDFTQVIRGALDDCDAVIAVIGPGWIAPGQEGTPRLHQPDDYVRLELGTALTRDLPVVPVLLGGAPLPPASELPEELRPLVQRQAVVVRDESWHQDVDGLVRSLRGEISTRPEPGRWRVRGALLLALLLVAGLLAWWQWPGGTEGDEAQDAEVPAACVPPGGEGWNPLAVPQNATGEVRSSEGTLAFTVRGGSWRPMGPGRWQVSLDTSMENRSSTEAYHGEWHYDSLVVGQRAFERTCFSPTPDLVLAGTVGDALVGFEVLCEPAGYIELILQESEARIPVAEASEPGPC